MAHDDDLESAYSVHIGFGTEKETKAASNEPKAVSKGTESSLELDEKKDAAVTGPTALTVVDQPEPVPTPTAKAIEDVAPRPPAEPRPPSRFGRVFFAILFGLGRVFLILGMGIGILVLSTIFMAISFGAAAANGALVVLVGNLVMKSAGHAGYSSDNARAAAIGAVGGILAAMIVGVVTGVIPKTSRNGEEPQHPWYIQFASTVLGGTLSGTIGCAILRRNNISTGGLDVLHATRAGALGGTIFGPGSIVIVPVIILVLGILLSPLWIAMSQGLEFVFSKSRESWTGDTYRYSGCHCWGTCGKDPEVQAEILRLQERQGY